MNNNRQYHNGRFIRFFKITFAIFAFVLPLFFLIFLIKIWLVDKALSLEYIGAFIPLIIFSNIPPLLAAYFITDLEMHDSGLIVEFLWKKLEIPWGEVLQIKPLFGIRAFSAQYVVVVKKLTPFHYLYGILYGFSFKPAFILWSTQDGYDTLKKEIEKQIKKNQKIKK